MGRGYKFEDNMKSTIAFLTFPKTKIEFFNLRKNGVKTKFCKTKLYSHNRLFGLKHRLDSVLARYSGKMIFLKAYP